MKAYLAIHSGGVFEFFADSMTLARDHARHHCHVMGWTLRRVEPK